MEVTNKYFDGLRDWFVHTNIYQIYDVTKQKGKLKSFFVI